MADLAVVHCPVQQRNPILGARLCKDIAHMIIDSAFADGEAFGDLLVGETFSYQFDDLDLPRGERNVRGIRPIATGHADYRPLFIPPS